MSIIVVVVAVAVADVRRRHGRALGARARGRETRALCIKQSLLASGSERTGAVGADLDSVRAKTWSFGVINGRMMENSQRQSTR